MLCCLLCCMLCADALLLLKACKNSREIEGALSAGRKDGAAIVSYLAWLEQQLRQGAEVDEWGSSVEMSRRRMLCAGAIGDSFPTISSAGANAAVIH